MKYLSWDEPCQGIDESGNEITCTRTVYMSEEDAAHVSRAMYKHDGRDYTTKTKEDLVADAVVVNWANRVEVDYLQ